jgi:hypothetical protein
MCTLLNRVPHGIAIIKYANPDDDWESFKGIGIFNEGRLHNSPFTCINEKG